LTNVIKGDNTNNLTKVIIEALKKHASVYNVNVVTKLMSFEVNGVNVFPRGVPQWGCPTNRKQICSSFGRHPLRHIA
jgi:hypothetical protein